MSNGVACCLLGVCCPPGGKAAVAALAEEMHEGLAVGAEDAGYDGIAAWIMDNFDLVPKGVGKAIIEGYAPEFAKKK